MTWSHSGGAERFDVSVGGRTVRVIGSARTATVTGSRPGTNDVTVTAVRAGVTRSASTTVIVGSTSTPEPSTTSPTTSPVTNRATPARTPQPPAEPTGLSGTRSGTSATVRFNRVENATNYTIYCDDHGTNTIAGTSGTVACGPDSTGRTVWVGVRANNAAGSSGVVRLWVDAP